MQSYFIKPRHLLLLLAAILLTIGCVMIVPYVLLVVAYSSFFVSIADSAGKLRFLTIFLSLAAPFVFTILLWFYFFVGVKNKRRFFAAIAAVVLAIAFYFAAPFLY